VAEMEWQIGDNRGGGISIVEEGQFPNYCRKLCI
jgi:hypothetical protein